MLKPPRFTTAIVLAGFFCPAFGLHAWVSPKPVTVQALRGSGAPTGPVMLRGVVTAFSGWKNSFFIEDATGGISVDRLENAETQPGDEVEVTGQVHPGLFAPVLESSATHVIAHRGLPKARYATYAELSSGELDSRLVAVSGVIQRARISQIWGRQMLLLDLETPSGPVKIYVHDIPPTVSANGDRQNALDVLIDSTVKALGVCGTIFNDRRQMLGLRLFVSSLKQIDVLAPSPSVAQIREYPIDGLGRFNTPLDNHRIKVRGSVTYQEGNDVFYLQQGGAAIRVQTERPGHWSPGASVIAAGFETKAESAPMLTRAVVEQFGMQAPPHTIRIKASDAIKSEDGFTQAPYNGLLVQIEGQIVELLPNTHSQLWVATDGDVRFQVELARRNRDIGIALEPGSRVDFTGICIAEADENADFRSFRLVLRSEEDIHIKSAPYWDSSFALLLVILLPMFLGSLAIWLVRHRRAERRGVVGIYSDRRQGTDPQQLEARLRRISLLLSGLTLLIGAFLVVSWIFDPSLPRQLFTDGVPAPNTALALLTAAVSVWLINKPENFSSSFARSAPACFSLLIAALTAVEYMTSRDLHIDGILLTLSGAHAEAFDYGRMFPGTALSILLASWAIVSVQRPGRESIGHLLATGSGIISLLNVTNWLYGSQARYGMGARATMPLATAVILLLLSVAVLLARPNVGLMRVLCSSGTGGLMARRVIPVAILAPMLLGWIRLKGQLAGFYDTRFGLSLFVISTIVCFGFVIWNSGAELNRSDEERSEAERALKDRDSKLAMVFETASMGDWTWDVVENRLFAHRVVWALYGEPDRGGPEPAEWFQSRQHPDDRAMIAREVEAAYAERRPLDVDFRVVQPDGSVKWLCCRATPVYDAAGKLIQVNGINFDVTESKLAALRLQESERLFRQLAEAMPQMVWTAGQDGVVNYLNRRWYEYTEAPIDDLWAEAMHDDDRKSLKGIWEESLRDGSPYQTELRLRRGSDGTYRWHVSRAEPIRNSEGRIERWFGTCTDIDDLKRASAELQALNENLENRVRQRSGELAESEQRYRLLVEGVRDYAIFMLDAQGRIATWNAGAEKIKGYTASEILGQHFSIFHNVAGVAGSSQRELKLAIEEGRYRDEGWRFRKDGSAFWADILITPMYDARGEVRGFSKITRDMTDQKKAEELILSEQRRAEEASRAKSRFLAAMSHEIRTPMNAILGMSDLLWETELDEVQRDYVGRFRRAGSNLLTLINDILDLSKIESGRFELESVDFCLSDLIDKTMELLAPRARVKGIELGARIVPGTPDSFIGDPGRLQQILNNLVGNAIKFTEKGSVFITTRVHQDGQPGHVQFEVSDTGIGIPADKLSAIFEDFTQAESSTTRRFGGTGLGLGICRRLVIRMGGALTVESVYAEGSKFTFDITVPVSEDKGEAKCTEVVDFAGRRVLVVDDNPTNRLIACEMCAGWGMAAVEAAGALEAYDLVQKACERQNLFSILMLDCMMPGVGGFEAFEQLKTIDSGLPIILTSSDNQPGDVTKARALGAAAYMMKPLRRAELLSVISASLRRSPQFETQPQKGLKAVEEHEAAERSMKILIADDSEDNRFLVAAYLKNRPYALTFVNNGREAVEEFGRREFDLVLMDVLMPVMDGLTAATSIRSLEAERGARRTPIIALSANALVEDIELSHAAGCDSHLTKPISKEKLVAALDAFQESSPAQDAARQRQVQTPFVIEIPEGFEELSRNYLKARQEEVSRLMRIASSENLEALRVSGHNMKGTGASYGFSDLSSLGAALEEAAKTADKRQVSECLTKLNEYVAYASEAVAQA